jgi:hypothetical protein
VSGTFSMISCASLLQVIEASKSTGVLRLEGGGGEGTLTFVRGTIVDAKMGELGGEDAAIELVTLEGARFSFKPLNGEAPDELSLSPQALLLDAAWLRDEVVHLEGHVPPAESRIEIVDAKALECFPNRPAWKKLVNDERQKVFALSTIALNLGIGSIRTRVMLAKGVQRKHLRVLPPGPEDEILILHEYDIIHEDGEDPASPPPVKRVRA